MARAPDFAAERETMVERQLRRRGIEDQRVLAAMAAVPRELFVPEPERRRAYADSALPIGYGQTISQPWIVAAICQALELEGDERVLEIGTGSGYSAAVLARLAAEVITIERIEELAADARRTLSELGIANVEVVVSDGSGGYPERAPYEGIAVHATAPGAPPSLIEQLAVGGRLVVPIAADGADMLTRFTRVDEDVDPRTGRGLERRSLGACRFVPLIGREGFEERGVGRWRL
ncbi:MAG TPA: protein-L-isoaspartate(D-aspartate) O-methyltransferase [Solirubrobacterales bacterium]|jgi:protein-L-isoaspartate(D-aspartate) O-methyltransferase|nr:protein-L-isoaspartate(D-aspartate) O-methyltransferase [Solirubrobacterales bacterium]